MSGVDIAGLVERLRALPTMAGSWVDTVRNETADALLAQAAELAEAGARHQKQVDYSIDLQRIVEALCDGRMPPEPETSARHHYDMAVEALAALKASEEARDAATKLADRYGVALMMIRAGCSNPQRFAGNILDDVKPIDIDLEDLT